MVKPVTESRDRPCLVSTLDPELAGIAFLHIPTSPFMLRSIADMNWAVIPVVVQGIKGNEIYNPLHESAASYVCNVKVSGCTGA